jgi:hypothetical protein
VAKKHAAIDGDVIVKPSDSHFWFGKPRIILYLIHFILFQNSFEIAFFFWILVSVFFLVSSMRRFVCNKSAQRFVDDLSSPRRFRRRTGSTRA